MFGHIWDKQGADNRISFLKIAKEALMGLLRLKRDEARELSSELREKDTRHLRHRRNVIGLSMLGGASLGLPCLNHKIMCGP